MMRALLKNRCLAVAIVTALALIAINGRAQFGGTHYSPPAGGVPSGVCVPYVGTTAPGGWYLAYGQALSNSTDPTLYALVGTTFGAAGTMPDLRGRVAAGVDAMGGTAANRIGAGSTGGITGTASLGATGGEQSHTLSAAQIPNLSATVNIYNVAGGNGVVDADGDFSMTGGGSVTASGSLPVNSGGGGAHNVVQPTLVLNYICKR